MKKCLGVFLLLAACSNSNGSATLSGDEAFTVTSQFAGSALTLEVPNASGGIILANVDPQPTCSEILDGGDNFIGKTVSLSLYPANGGLVTANTYSLVLPLGNPPAGSFAYLAVVLLTDGGLNALTYASSGTLTLTAVGSTWDGHFDSQLFNRADGGSLGALSGTFSAPVCP